MSGVPVGSFASSRLASRVDLNLPLRATSAIAVLGAALFFLVAVTGMVNVATVLGPMILFSVGVGAASPASCSGNSSSGSPENDRLAPSLPTAFRAVPAAHPPDYPSEVTISRYAASGNAFSVFVRTLPSDPSSNVKRAATASSGAS